MATKKIKKESSNSNAEQGQESKKNTLVPVLHEIECTCDNIFEVFSVYEEGVNDGFKESWVRCPECSLYHNVIEINRSMISKRLPHGKKLINLPDDKIPEQISAILLAYELSDARKQFFTWSYKNGKIGTEMTLESKVSPEDGEIIGTRIKIVGINKIQVFPFKARTFAIEEKDGDTYEF